MPTLKTPSGHKVREMVAALADPVAELLVRMAHAQLERESANKRHATILNAGDYLDDEGNRITDPSKSWHIHDEEQAKAYYALCDQANIEAGYDLEPGFCPALIAEHEQIKAEWALLEAAEKFFPGVDNDKLLCAGLEKRKDYIDLLIKLVVNYDGK